MKDNAYQQHIVTRTPITQVELITISTATIRSICTTLMRPIFAFLQTSTANLQILWRHLPMEHRNV